MSEQFTIVARARVTVWAVTAFLVAFSLHPRPAEAGQTGTVAVACTEAALRSAIAQANAAGGTITFTCRDTTIPMTLGLGDILSHVVIDGEGRNVTLEYTGDLAGCVSGPPIGRMRGQRSIVRHLTFRNFQESLQISGPENTVEDDVFLAHSCSDDGVSTTTMSAKNTTVRSNRFQGYRDKAFQMSYGSGTIEGNTFIDSAQPIRGPYANTSEGWSVGTFVIRNNVMRTTSDRSACAGPHFDGTYDLVIEGNTIQCYRGLRLGGSTQAIVRNNTIDGNPRGGVQLRGSAVASLSGNVITNNGLSAGSEPAGGVVVYESATADLGGGTLTIGGQAITSTGRNRLQGNGVADVRNMRSGYTVKAEANCWDHATAADVTASDSVGTVDVDPIGSTCGATTGQAPSPPTNVRVASP